MRQLMCFLSIKAFKPQHKYNITNLIMSRMSLNVVKLWMAENQQTGSDRIYCLNVKIHFYKQRQRVSMEDAEKSQFIQVQVMMGCGTFTVFMLIWTSNRLYLSDHQLQVSARVTC